MTQKKLVQIIYITPDNYPEDFRYHGISPEERQKAYDAIVERHTEEQQKKCTPISDEALRLKIERDRVSDDLSKVTNNLELDTWKNNFIRVHKEYLRALGFKLCEATDCAKIIIGRRESAKYCSDGCKNRQAGRRKRMKNPEGHLRAKKRYIEFQISEKESER